MVELVTDDVTGLLHVLAKELTSVERDEVRVLVLPDPDPDPEPGQDNRPGSVDPWALAAGALRAPTLAQLDARSRHCDLASLLADELAHFYSVYQPIVRLEDAAVVGHEALLRASGPTGTVMPDTMFAAAAEAGWIHMLDRIGRTTALLGAEGWLADDLLFVNFVPTTIYRPEVCLHTTERAALDAGLRLDQLVFEITESEEVHDLDHLARLFSYYKAKGCKVALDDLGSGFSSLNLMVQLEPDVVKIDRETVQRLPGKVATAIVGAIVDIGRAGGTVVLAEGIETAEQASAARDLGVELGQGWYFGRPALRTTHASELASRRGAATAAPEPAALQSMYTVDPAVATRAALAR
jgi:EAL domain-containing protein (putative c-di-GMP-specific phosphodiesterase class I)